MEYNTKYPLSAGFLFPNEDYYPTMGKGHENTAYRILQNVFKMNILDINDPEDFLQDKYSAILIRYRWGEKLIYLPKTAPKTYQECEYFREAINFYLDNGFQIININNISLDFDNIVVRNFIGEEYETIKLFTFKSNYTQTIIKDSSGNYMYNPERIGD